MLVLCTVCTDCGAVLHGMRPASRRCAIPLQLLRMLRGRWNLFKTPGARTLTLTRRPAPQVRRDNPWVEESALFFALTQVPELLETPWWTWPEPLRLRCARPRHWINPRLSLYRI